MSPNERNRTYVMLAASAGLVVGGFLVYVGPLDSPLGLLLSCTGAALIGREHRRRNDRRSEPPDGDV